MMGEIGYSELAEILGWDMVPQTETVDLGYGEGTCQAFVIGGEPWDGDEGIKITEKHFNDLAQIFVMDTIVGNIDRHYQNIKLKDDGRAWAIDNDLWTGNNDLYDRGNAENSFDSLSRAVRGEAIQFDDDRMINWLTASLDESQFGRFEDVVGEKLEELLEHKDDIEETYDVGDQLNPGAIKNHIEMAERYLSCEL